MDTEERRSLTEQLAVHKRNLHALEMQKAQFGITPPVSILNGIKLEQDAIASIERQLAQGGAADPPSEPAAPTIAPLDYALGLRAIKDGLPEEALDDFFLFEARLQENLDAERRYGPNDGNRSERARVVGELNRLARQYLGRSFNQLSQPAPAPERPPAPAAAEPPVQPDLSAVPNPFGITGRIDDPEKVFGRDALLRRLFEELRKRSNCALIGETGVGKSTLLSMVRKLGPARLGLAPEAFVVLDMRLLRNENQFFDVLCKRLGVAALRGYDLIDALSGRRAIVCLDNIELMTKAHFTGDEREELRGLADGEDAPLKLVVASSQPLAKLFPDTPMISSPLANLCLTLNVLPFSPAVVRQFIATRLAGTGVAFAEAEIAQLIASTGGNPARLQREAAVLFEQHREAAQ